jgi:hypothetical protein
MKTVMTNFVDILKMYLILERSTMKFEIKTEGFITISIEKGEIKTPIDIPTRITKYKSGKICIFLYS